MIYLEKPDDFNPRFEIVSCFDEYDGEILLLERQDHKPEPNTFGVAAGKIDIKDSDSLEAMLREKKEETGINSRREDLTFYRTVFVRYSDKDFIYHMFHQLHKERPKVVINPKEHKSFRWVNPREALKLPLIQDEDICIKLFYGIE